MPMQKRRFGVRLFKAVLLFTSTILFIGFQNFDYVEFTKIQKQEKDRVGVEERELRGIASMTPEREALIIRKVESWAGFDSQSTKAEETNNASEKSKSKDYAGPNARALKWQRLNKVNLNLSEQSNLSFELDPSKGQELALSHSFSANSGLKVKKTGNSDQTQVEFQMKW